MAGAPAGGDGDHTPADQQGCLAGASVCKPAPVQANGVLVASKQLLCADFTEHPDEDREAVRELLVGLAHRVISRCIRQVGIRGASERGVIFGTHEASVEAFDEHPCHEERGVGDAAQLGDALRQGRIHGLERRSQGD